MDKLCFQINNINMQSNHRKRIIVAVYRSPKPYKIMSDCCFNTRKIQNARLILKWTNQSIFCTSSAPMSVSSALFCSAAIPNVTDIAMHIFCASRRTCTTTYSLLLHEMYLKSGGFETVVKLCTLHTCKRGGNQNSEVLIRITNLGSSGKPTFYSTQCWTNGRGTLLSQTPRATCNLLVV